MKKRIFKKTFNRQSESLYVLVKMIYMHSVTYFNIFSAKSKSQDRIVGKPQVPPPPVWVGLFFSGGGDWGGAKTLVGQIFTGGPLDSVFSQYFQKKFSPAAGLNQWNHWKGDWGGRPPNPPSPPGKKKPYVWAPLDLRRFNLLLNNFAQQFWSKSILSYFVVIFWLFCCQIFWHFNNFFYIY